jgi:hypothetical protein
MPRPSVARPAAPPAPAPTTAPPAAPASETSGSMMPPGTEPLAF